MVPAAPGAGTGAGGTADWPPWLPVKPLWETFISETQPLRLPMTAHCGPLPAAPLALLCRAVGVSVVLPPPGSGCVRHDRVGRLDRRLRVRPEVHLKPVRTHPPVGPSRRTLM